MSAGNRKNPYRINRPPHVERNSIIAGYVALLLLVAVVVTMFRMAIG